MARISVLTTFFLLLCTLIIVLGHNSPCYEYFEYLFDSTKKEKYGQIQILPPKNVSEFRITVVMSIATQILQSDYVGRVDLAQSDGDFEMAVQQGKPLFYRVTFPLKKPTPLLTGIWLNDQEYCTGPIAQGEFVTSIEIRYLARLVPYTPGRAENKKTKSPVNVDDDCGNISNPNKDVNPFNSKGVNISPGQWPWLVAIFVINLDFDFQCAGNILTNRHVLTAAHCFKINKEQNINIPPSAMIASLGRYRLREWHELGSVNREIQSYVLHPDYTHKESGDSDLAIFTLRDPVEFSPTIRPICLWSGSSNLRDVINIRGYVAGWSRDEYSNTSLAKPRMVTVPIVTQEDCHWSDERFVTFTSNRTFCAGLQVGSGSSNGGSGLIIYNTTTSRYHLRGIVSRSLCNRDEKTCDLSQYVVYVDITKYKEWIQQQISTG